MQHLVKRPSAKMIALLVANILYFSLVNPDSSKSLILFGAFLLLAVDLFLLFKLILIVLGQLTGKKSLARNRVAGLATIAIIVMLALQSIGQLSVRDAVAVIFVGIIFLFYSSFYRFGQRS